MHGSKTRHQKRRSLVDNLERLRVSANLDRGLWTDILGLPVHEYEEVLRKQRVLGEASLIRVAECFGLTYQQLRTGEIDFRAIALASNTEKADLPERYQVGAFSRMNSMISALDYLDDVVDWRWRYVALKRLGINESSVADPLKMTNIQLITDLTNLLQKFRFPGGLAYEMGTYSVVTNHGGILWNEFSTAKDPSQVYQRIFGDLQHLYEKNCDYRIVSLKGSRCVIQGKSKPEVAEALRVREVGNSHTCTLKAGIMASAPAYLGLSLAEVEETTCVHRGDSNCTYEIDFQRASEQLGSRRMKSASAYEEVVVN